MAHFKISVFRVSALALLVAGLGYGSGTALAGFEFNPAPKPAAPAKSESAPEAAPAMPALPKGPVETDSLTQPPAAALAPAPAPVMAAPVPRMPEQMQDIAPTAAASKPAKPQEDGFVETVGFGSDIPLPLAMRQIVPADYAYVFDKSIDQSSKISWNGGKPWDIVLTEALQPLGYVANVDGNRVIITREDQTQTASAAPVPQEPTPMIMPRHAVQKADVKPVKTASPTLVKSVIVEPVKVEPPMKLAVPSQKDAVKSAPIAAPEPAPLVSTVSSVAQRERSSSGPGPILATQSSRRAGEVIPPVDREDLARPEQVGSLSAATPGITASEARVQPETPARVPVPPVPMKEAHVPGGPDDMPHEFSAPVPTARKSLVIPPVPPTAPAPMAAKEAEESLASGVKSVARTAPGTVSKPVHEVYLRRNTTTPEAVDRTPGQPAQVSTQKSITLTPNDASQEEKHGGFWSKVNPANWFDSDEPEGRQPVRMEMKAEAPAPAVVKPVAKMEEIKPVSAPKVAPVAADTVTKIETKPEVKPVAEPVKPLVMTETKPEPRIVEIRRVKPTAPIPAHAAISSSKDVPNGRTLKPEPIPANAIASGPTELRPTPGSVSKAEDAKAADDRPVMLSRGPGEITTPPPPPVPAKAPAPVPAPPVIAMTPAAPQMPAVAPTPVLVASVPAPVPAAPAPVPPQAASSSIPPEAMNPASAQIVSQKAPTLLERNARPITPIAPSQDKPSPAMARAAAAMDTEAWETWEAPKGASLRSTLQDWADRSKVQLYWVPTRDFQLPQPVHIEGSFTDAIASVLGSYGDKGLRPLGRLHPNLPKGPAVLIIEPSSGS